jgi:AbrB family looped-hinge helix DNA binding protein
MKTTIDSAGRLVIPKEIRRDAGLRPGMPLEVRLGEGRIEITPAPLPVKLVRRGRLLVAVPHKNVAPLTEETVARTRQAVRQKRSRHA